MCQEHGDGSQRTEPLRCHAPEAKTLPAQAHAHSGENACRAFVIFAHIFCPLGTSLRKASWFFGNRESCRHLNVSRAWERKSTYGTTQMPCTRSETQLAKAHAHSGENACCAFVNCAHIFRPLETPLRKASCFFGNRESCLTSECLTSMGTEVDLAAQHSCVAAQLCTLRLTFSVN